MKTMFFSKGTPVYRPWGGVKFSPLPGQQAPIGEVWAVSTHKEGESLVDGIKLSKYWQDHFPQTWNKVGSSYLVKWLDTESALSAQVHPNDQYSKLHEGQLGKSECWIILEARPGAHLYLGLKPGVKRDQFIEACQRNQGVPELMQRYDVRPGDFFYVPAGSVHALGPGLSLVEVQQSSGVTYRLWDWGRVDAQGRPRELHIEKGREVINDDTDENTPHRFLAKNLDKLKEAPTLLVDSRDFQLSFKKMSVKERFTLQLQPRTLSSIFCLKGAVNIVQNQEQIELQEYQGIVSFVKGPIELYSSKESWIAWVE